MAWLDLGRYAREGLVAQDSRGFVLGFTICGSFMRIWAFDLLGGIASEQFDINKYAQCVFTTFGFLWMNEKQLGFNPIIATVNGEQFIEMKKANYHARYYHHETVQIDGADDDVRDNVRRGLDIMQAANYRRSHVVPGTSRQGRDRASGSNKRSSSQVDASLPLSKRSCSFSPTKAASIVANRVHRCVILRDYGKPIYKASSKLALLAAFELCIERHESMHRAGFLDRDISIDNPTINEDDDTQS
ncbi:hypothetical protein FOMG_17735 [Fusarium oxysporum f. sp. melonis 26406]|uniref:Fungal-type protein kinase domain-containing protein n=1 Tax=Fusarium oxysporum f. sp. melonis 26406 TaxID=1089452 RepID=W9ZX13_FUSOX|nr:hypothetical protein FOMG_17735 [Fusarium oxysporum f. sp. melonis 26406]